MQGDIAKARAACQDFLTLWKEADPTSRPEGSQGRLREAAIAKDAIRPNGLRNQAVPLKFPAQGKISAIGIFQ